MANAGSMGAKNEHSPKRKQENTKEQSQKRGDARCTRSKNHTTRPITHCLPIANRPCSRRGPAEFLAPNEKTTKKISRAKNQQKEAHTGTEEPEKCDLEQGFEKEKSF